MTEFIETHLHKLRNDSYLTNGNAIMDKKRLFKICTSSRVNIGLKINSCLSHFCVRQVVTHSAVF